MDEQTKLLKVFSDQLIKFIEELIIKMPQEPDFQILKLFIKQQIPIKDLMKGWIRQMDKNEGKIRNMINDRNDNFFMTENPFKFLSEQRVNKLSLLWKDLSDSEQNTIWCWMDLFLKISDKYKNTTSI